MEKEVYFLADSRQILRSFPAQVRLQFGYEILRLQQGLQPAHYRHMTQTIGPGVAELKVKHRGEYRAFYSASLGDAIYVISAFRKKTRKTPKKEIELAKRRLAELKNETRRS